MVTVASTMQLQEAEARGCFPNPNASTGVESQLMLQRDNASNLLEEANRT